MIKTTSSGRVHQNKRTASQMREARGRIQQLYRSGRYPLAECVPLIAQQLGEREPLVRQTINDLRRGLGEEPLPRAPRKARLRGAGCYKGDDELNQEVLALRRAGKTFEEIGEELGLSGQTVSKRYRQAMNKPAAPAGPSDPSLLELAPAPYYFRSHPVTGSPEVLAYRTPSPFGPECPDLAHPLASGVRVSSCDDPVGFYLALLHGGFPVRGDGRTAAEWIQGNSLLARAAEDVARIGRSQLLGLLNRALLPVDNSAGFRSFLELGEPSPGSARTTYKLSRLREIHSTILGERTDLLGAVGYVEAFAPRLLPYALPPGCSHDASFDYPDKALWQDTPKTSPIYDASCPNLLHPELGHRLVYETPFHRLWEMRRAVLSNGATPKTLLHYAKDKQARVPLNVAQVVLRFVGIHDIFRCYVPSPKFPGLPDPASPSPCLAMRAAREWASRLVDLCEVAALASDTPFAVTPQAFFEAQADSARSILENKQAGLDFNVFHGIPPYIGLWIFSLEYRLPVEFGVSAAHLYRMARYACEPHLIGSIEAEQQLRWGLDSPEPDPVLSQPGCPLLDQLRAEIANEPELITDEPSGESG